MWGSIAQWLGYLLPDPATPGLIPSASKKNSEENIVDVAEVNQRRCLEECGQWLENDDETHLVLAGAKQALQKIREKLVEFGREISNVVIDHNQMRPI